jgi:hypothetical protein
VTARVKQTATTMITAIGTVFKSARSTDVTYFSERRLGLPTSDLSTHRCAAMCGRPSTAGPPSEADAAIGEARRILLDRHVWAGKGQRGTG